MRKVGERMKDDRRLNYAGDYKKDIRAFLNREITDVVWTISKTKGLNEEQRDTLRQLVTCAELKDPSNRSKRGKNDFSGTYTVTAKSRIKAVDGPLLTNKVAIIDDDEADNSDGKKHYVLYQQWTLNAPLSKKPEIYPLQGFETVVRFAIGKEGLTKKTIKSIINNSLDAVMESQALISLINMYIQEEYGIASIADMGLLSEQRFDIDGLSYDLAKVATKDDKDSGIIAPCFIQAVDFIYEATLNLEDTCNVVDPKCLS